MNIRLTAAANWCALIWVNVWLAKLTFGGDVALGWAAELWEIVRGMI